MVYVDREFEFPANCLEEIEQPLYNYMELLLRIHVTSRSIHIFVTYIPLIYITHCYSSLNCSSSLFAAWQVAWQTLKQTRLEIDNY